MDERNFLIVGMARSGVAAAKMLRELDKDFRIRLSDKKARADFPDGYFDALDEGEFEWRLSEAPEDVLEGMDVAVISPGIPIDHPLILRAREMGIPVIGEVELATRVMKGKLIAITGTNGKTTTTSLVGEVLSNAGIRAHVAGNIGYPITAIALSSRPEDAVVCELSSFQLESVDRFHPHVAAVLNISEDHMDRHHTMENYIALKARVFKTQDAGDFAVLNYDSEVTRAMGKDARAQVLWFSGREAVDDGAYVDDGMIVFSRGGAPKNVCPVSEVNIPGPHNLENALAATAIAAAMDVPLPVIRHTLRTFKGVEHRIEFVREVNGVRFINDSKGTNCDSTIKAIETMDRPTVMIMGGSDKHVDMQSVIDKIVGSNIRRVVLIGEMANPLSELLNAAGFHAHSFAGYNFELAVETAYKAASPGWNVLLSPACASFDMFKDFEDRGAAFKRLVRDIGDRPA